MGVPADRARSPVPDDEGSDWLYWEPKTRRWRHVEVVSVPTVNPHRVKVQYLDSDGRSRAEWAPARRLRVPWERREAYLEREARWSRVSGHTVNGWERNAAWTVLWLSAPSEVADLHEGGAGGVLDVGDLQELSRLTGIAGEDLTDHADSFVEVGHWYLPWPSTVVVVAALGQRHSKELIEIVASEVREVRRSRLEAIEESAEYIYGTLTQRSEVVTEYLANMPAGYDVRHRALLRWAEAETPGLADEFAALSRRYDELATAVLPALSQLRSRRTQKATEIEQRIRDLLTAQ